MEIVSERTMAASPFRLRVPPAEAVAHRSWRQAHADALQALSAGASVVVLGLPGTGKTLLLQRLAQDLRARGLRVTEAIGPEALPQTEDWDVLVVDEAGTLTGDGLNGLRPSS